MKQQPDPIGEPWWDDRPAILLGGGDSLRGYDLSNLREKGRVILINDAVKFTTGDVLFSADSNWIATRRDGHEGWPGYRTWEGEEIILALNRILERPTGENRTRTTYPERVYHAGMSHNPSQVAAGGNSGFCCLNATVLKKAKLVYLLGFDMAPGSHRHWHNGYLGQKRSPNKHYYSGWAKNFDNVARWLNERTKVINLSHESTITAFEKGRYEDLGLRKEALPQSGETQRE